MALQGALDSLLGEKQTGDLGVDLVAAAHEAVRRRERNSIDGGAIFKAMQEELNMSVREIAAMIGMPYQTVYAWATPPKRTPDSI